MKKIWFIALCSVLVFASASWTIPNSDSFSNSSPSSTEYAIIRSFYVKKTEGILSRFDLDLGSNPNHSLKQKIQLTAEEELLITQPGGKKIIITSDTDMLEFMATNNWTLIRVDGIEVAGRNMIQYLFSKVTE